MITKDLISFAMPNDTIEVDSIPMNEILHVTIMSSEETSLQFADAASHEHFSSSILQIDTAPNGRNFGRMYYLRSRDNESVKPLRDELRTLNKDARYRAETATLWRRAQSKVIPSPFPILAASLNHANRHHHRLSSLLSLSYTLRPPFHNLLLFSPLPPSLGERDGRRKRGR